MVFLIFTIWYRIFEVYDSSILVMISSHSVPTGPPLFEGCWVLQEVKADYGPTPYHPGKPAET